MIPHPSTDSMASDSEGETIGSFDDSKSAAAGMSTFDFSGCGLSITLLSFPVPVFANVLRPGLNIKSGFAGS